MRLPDKERCLLLLEVNVCTACTVVVGKTEGKGPLGRRRRRWEDTIKMGWKDVDVVNVAQDRGRWQAVVSLRVMY